MAEVGVQERHESKVGQFSLYSPNPEGGDCTLTLTLPEGEGITIPEGEDYTLTLILSQRERELLSQRERMNLQKSSLT